MISQAAAHRKLIWLSLAAGASFFASARVSHLSVGTGNGLAAIWIGNGLLLGILLHWTRGAADTASACAAAFVAGVLSSLVDRHQLSSSIVFASFDVLEVVIAYLLLRRLDAASSGLVRVRDVAAFVAACIVAPIVPSALGAGSLVLMFKAPFLSRFVGWYLSGALGLALVTPCVGTIAGLAAAVRQSPLRARAVSEIIAVLGLAAGLALFVFYGSRHQSTFLLMPVILLATFRLRQFGAVAAISIIAIIAATATVQGLGPMTVAFDHSTARLIYLQLFLATLFVSALPVAAALAERDQRAEEARMMADEFKAVVENITEVIFRTDLSGRWVYLNPAWEELSGYPIAESLGRSWRAVIDPDVHREVAEWARPVFAGEVAWTRRLVRFRTAWGGMRWMELSLHAQSGTDGVVIGSTGMLRDVHDRKHLEEQVMSAKRLAEERERAATLLASTDELTGLPNRRAFLAHLDRLVTAGTPLAVAIFDVDHFKAVNDQHGHAVGDRVLERVAARAVGVVRSGDIVGRIGGEEFGIVMPGADAEAAMTIADRLRAALAEDGNGAKRPLPSVTVSVGIAVLSPGRNDERLLDEADAALYAAKGSGRDRTRIAAFA